jgi:hypothetical protein
VLDFASSAFAQVASRGIEPSRAVAIGCAILVVTVVILAVALHFSSLPGFIAASVVSGRRGLAAVAERTPSDRRVEVSSTYFVVAYVAISCRESVRVWRHSSGDYARPESVSLSPWRSCRASTSPRFWCRRRRMLCALE